MSYVVINVSHDVTFLKKYGYKPSFNFFIKCLYLKYFRRYLAYGVVSAMGKKARRSLHQV